MRFLSVAGTSDPPSERSMSGADTTAPPGIGTRPTSAGITAARMRRLGMSAEANPQSAARWPPWVSTELSTNTPTQIAMNEMMPGSPREALQRAAEPPNPLPASNGSATQAPTNETHIGTFLGTTRIRTSVANTATVGDTGSGYQRPLETK